MKRFIKYTMSSILTLSVVGCATYRVGDFTVISTKNINLNSGKLQSGSTVTGTDSSFFSPVYLKNAVDNAIEQDKCVVGLSDAVLSLETGLKATYVVKGTQIIDRSLPNCQNR